MQSKLKYLWAYSASSEDAVKWNEKQINRRRQMGYDIEGFCVTPQYLNGRHWSPYPDLEHQWKVGYPPLIKMYRELNDALNGKDVLIHYNGANICADIIKEIKQFKVYTCGDDPESTEILSKPVAAYYDIQLVNNAACVDMYQSWGLSNSFFWPLGSLVTPEEVTMTDEKILDIGNRNIKIVYIGERNQWKNDFFSVIEKKYREGQYWGKGWSNGYISKADMDRLYRNSQIGVNVHNSIGPINFRLYELAAYGVMQICDNKKYLGNVFELDKEVVGFDSTDECLGLIEHYLTHVGEQRDIALAARHKWLEFYTPDAVWKLLVSYVESIYQKKSDVDTDLVKLLDSQEKKYNIPNRLIEKVRNEHGGAEG